MLLKYKVRYLRWFKFYCSCDTSSNCVLAFTVLITLIRHTVASVNVGHGSNEANL